MHTAAAAAAAATLQLQRYSQPGLWTLLLVEQKTRSVAVAKKADRTEYDYITLQV